MKKFSLRILKNSRQPFLRDFFAFGLLAIIGIAGCGGGGGGSSPPSTYVAETGVAQKGPLIKASTVTAQELDSRLSPTGKQYNYQTASDLGTFVPTSPFSSKYVGLYATGYYYDEVAGTVSVGPVTLNGYSDLTESPTLNVNLLTTLAYQRIQHLVTVSGMAFTDAEMQAEDEVLAALKIPVGSYGSFGTLDLAGGTDGDHILAAVSSLFICASGTPGNLSSLIADFQSDLAQNGTITNSATKAALDRGARVMDSVAIAANLTHKYSIVGVSFTASDIENWIDRDNDGVVGKFEFRVLSATVDSLFTLPDFVIEQVAGKSISTTAGKLWINESLVMAPTLVVAGDVVSVSPGGATFSNGVFDVYIESDGARVARVQFISGSTLIDQYVPVKDPLQSAGIFSDQWAAQTFTVGITGRLDSLSLLLYNGGSTSTGEINIEVRRFSLIESVPDSCPLGCISIDFSRVGLVTSSHILATDIPLWPNTNVWTSVAFGTQGPILDTGQQFAIVLTSVGGSSINWRNTNDSNSGNGNTYPLGQSYAAQRQGIADNIWISLGNADFNFATVTAPAPGGLR